MQKKSVDIFGIELIRGWNKLSLSNMYDGAK
jgi:hypothetical protein